MKRRFHQLDVFSAQPLKGNPLAVVHGAVGLSDTTMANFARWTNVSETTFLLPPTTAGADFRVRIFTPGGELPFAGHPTLGSCAAWLAGGGTPRQDGLVVQECGVGLVRIRRDDSHLAFAAPKLLRSGPLHEPLLVQIVGGIGLPRDAILRHQWVDNGPGWCAVMLDSGATVRAVKPDWAALGDVKLGLVGAQPAGADTQFENARLRTEDGCARRPGHRQLERRTGAVADRRGPCPAALRGGAGHGAGPRQSRARARAARWRRLLDRRRGGVLYRGLGDAVAAADNGCVTSRLDNFVVSRRAFGVGREVCPRVSCPRVSPEVRKSFTPSTA